MNKIAGIKAISFDADGTLWDFDTVMRHSLRCALTELEKACPDAAGLLSVDKMIRIRNRVAAELKGRVISLEDVRHEAFRQTLRDIGKPDDALATRLTHLFLERRFKDIKLFDDAFQVLEVLRKKYTLGILSNGNCYPERCGLGGVFTFAVFAENHGVAKPDPKLFQITLRNAGCSEHQLLHVGDSLEEDVEGAIRAGIKSVWLNRKHEKNSSRIRPDFEIASLLELLNIL